MTSSWTRAAWPAPTSTACSNRLEVHPLLDALKAVVPGGVVCATGLLGGTWIIDHFEPIGEIPTGVNLTTFGSAVIGGERWVEALQEIVDPVEEGQVHAILDRTYGLDDMAAAHAYMEQPGHRQGGRHPVNA